MKITNLKSVAWLLRQTLLVQYFAIAVLFHSLIAVGLLFFHLPSVIRATIAVFDPGSLPPPARVDDVDPFAALRDFDYRGPTLGDGGGTPGKGPGGIPTAAGTTPTEYKASIVTSEKSAADSQLAEVIGVVSESADAVARLQGGGLSGVSAPTAGFGQGKLGTAGVRGPGGGGFGQRVGPMRAQRIKASGGTGETEKSVLAALRWLKEHQEPDGSWKSIPEPMTALAALCFLGHGETPDSEEFGATVSKAISYLANCVGPDGMVKSRNMYSHGAVTLALAEAYGMTQSPVVREPLERAVKAILNSQKAAKKNKNDIGGWRYAPDSTDADVSVTGWLVMGLKSAKLAGLTIPEEDFTMSSEYLWKMYDARGGFGYAGPGQGVATTAVGILCQQFLGHFEDKRLKKALDFYKVMKVDWEKAGGYISLYAWYYATQAMFQGGGAYWEHWNKEIRGTLVKMQSSDGHWDYPTGGGNTQFGPVLSTTLCCLMLEVYYRYLPLYKEMELKSLPGGAGAQSTSTK